MPNNRAGNRLIALALATIIAATAGRPAFANDAHSFRIASADASTSVREFAKTTGVQISGLCRHLERQTAE